MAENTTSVRLPDELVEALDRRAAALGLTRSQLIVRAVEALIAESTEWSPRLLEAIGASRPELDAAVGDLMAVNASRRSRGAAREP